jgi:hypothetical protein
MTLVIAVQMSFENRSIGFIIQTDSIYLYIDSIYYEHTTTGVYRSG